MHQPIWKTCSFRHDALPPSHLFLVVSLLPLATTMVVKGTLQPSRLNPRPHRPLAIKCWNDSGQLVLSQKSQCLKGVGESKVSKLNQFESHQKKTSEWGVRKGCGLYIYNHIYICMTSFVVVFVGFKGCDYLWNMGDYIMTITIMESWESCKIAPSYVSFHFFSG